MVRSSVTRAVPGPTLAAGGGPNRLDTPARS
jgi:hypothetical protein